MTEPIDYKSSGVDLDAYEPVLTLQTPAHGVCRLPSRPATLDHRPASLLENI